MKEANPLEEECRQEAERLALLDEETQKKALALIRAPADNPKLGKRDREAAHARAAALGRHLRRLHRKKKK
jgi:hypothetical protein